MDVVEPRVGECGVTIAIEAERALLCGLGDDVVGDPVRTEGLSVWGIWAESAGGAGVGNSTVVGATEDKEAVSIVLAWTSPHATQSRMSC